jgi:hypothetical protein
MVLEQMLQVTCHLNKLHCDKSHLNKAHEENYYLWYFQIFMIIFDKLNNFGKYNGQKLFNLAHSNAICPTWKSSPCHFHPVPAAVGFEPSTQLNKLKFRLSQDGMLRKPSSPIIDGSFHIQGNSNLTKPSLAKPSLTEASLA